MTVHCYKPTTIPSEGEVIGVSFPRKMALAFLALLPSAGEYTKLFRERFEVLAAANVKIAVFWVVGLY